MSLDAVLEELRAAEARAGRAVGAARLVAVSKGRSEADIRRAGLLQGSAHGALQGAFPLAENRGQELRDKAAQLEQAGEQPEWHFIGPLQRNKIKYLRPVSLVHTLEEAWQPGALARAAEGWGRAPAVLIQRHNGEAQKHGADDDELPQLARAVRESGLELRGLMVMAPYADAEAAVRVFRETRLRAHDLGLSELSMGMSDDFPLAVAEGATLVRVGRRLFL